MSASDTYEMARDYGKSAAQAVGQSTALQTVESVVSNLPANALLTAAFASIAISLTLKLSGDDRDAKFVGQWAPTFVGLAVFTKLVQHARRTHS